MFAKPKATSITETPAPSARPGNAVSRWLMVARLSLKLAWVFLKRPYVAPSLIMLALMAGIGLLMSLGGVGDGGSPTVRVSVARAKPQAETHLQAAVPAPESGQQAFTLDSTGLFQDQLTSQTGPAPADAGDGVNVITLGESGTPTAPAARFDAKPLGPAPVAGLVQSTPDGPLPVIGPQGMTPSSAYARPFQSNGKPMVAVVIGGLGLNPTMTKAAIEQLPPEITLSFVPYATGLQDWINQARAHGHEVMIEIPMQPANYPDNDPGPQTLMSNARPDELMTHLNWALSRATGYFGVINYQGASFLRDRSGTAIFLNVLRQRGISFVDDGAARDMGGAWGRVSADRIIDQQISGPAIAAQLGALEQGARQHAQALGSAYAYPVTIGTILSWSSGLAARGLQLAPASALTHR